jgi:hypothetical protein
MNLIRGFLVLLALVAALAMLSGCAKESADEVEIKAENASPPQVTEAPPHVAEAPPPGPNPFTGPPELQACLRKGLGDEAFNALAAQTRRARPEEKAIIEDCIREFESVVPPPQPGRPKEARWETVGVAIAGKYADAEVVEVEEGKYRMYFGIEPEVARGELSILSAISSDGISWDKEAGVRVEDAVFPDVVRLPDGRFRMYFQRGGVIVSAVSEDGIAWAEEPGVRIGRGGHSGLDDLGVGASSTIVLEDGSYLMVYRTEKAQRFCERSPNTYSTFLFYAVSKDGLNFEKRGMVLDPRGEKFCDLADGAELVRWDDGKVHLFFWSHKGIYESVYDGGAFSEPELVFPRAPGEQPPADPTLIKIGEEWFMYYGQHGSGIFIARLRR